MIIADDEKPARDAIKTYLAKNESFVLLDECEDGAGALSSIERNKPDLVLLDIEMPEQSGIEILRSLESASPHIVFVTAYSDYAVQAFEENAIDYLLKPFDGTRFDQMLSRVIDKMRQESGITTKALVDGLQQLQKLEKEKYLKKIPVKRKGKISFVPVEEVIWIESSGSFTKLHLSDSIEIANHSIGQLEDILDPALHIRIHKSHMINLDCIVSIESYFHGEYIVNLQDGTDLKLSRSYKAKLDRIMNQYK